MENSDGVQNDQGNLNSVVRVSGSESNVAESNQVIENHQNISEDIPNFTTRNNTSNKSKKRDCSSAKIFNSNMNSCKLMKLNCDNSNDNDGCDKVHDPSSSSNLTKTVTDVIENLNIECKTEAGGSSGSNAENSSERIDKKPVSEQDTAPCDMLSVANDTIVTRFNSGTSRDMSNSTSSSPSSSNIADLGASQSNLPGDDNSSVTEESVALNETNSPMESSSCSSSSSCTFSSMSSLYDDEEFSDDNFSLVLDDSENAPTVDSNKYPAVLRKTLPTDTISIPREIMLRQINCGDSRRRSRSRFDTKLYASRSMVQRLQKFRTLKKHAGCVNTLSFNTSGDVLISASDDHYVCLWDWVKGKCDLNFNSGHVANVFQAKFLPYSNDSKLITCGQDHMVRLCLLGESGLQSTTLIAKHDRAVHKIAMQPQIPNSFLSAGEDGVVFSIDVREKDPRKLLKVTGDSESALSTICLYSVSCNPMKNYEFIVSGNSKKIRLYDQRKVSPTESCPIKEFEVHATTAEQHDFIVDRKFTSVTCVTYNYNGTEILASYNDNDVFLFNANDDGNFVFRYDGHRNFATIKGVSFFGLRSEYIVSGSDCGYIYIWDKKSESIVQWLKGDRDIVNCLEPHPVYPVLATSGLESNVKVWMPGSTTIGDLRMNEEFHEVVRQNSFYKVMGSAESELEVSLFYFLASGRRA